MKKCFVWLGLVLTLSGLPRADSGQRAMVLMVKGAVLAQTQQVLTGQLLEQGSTLQLPAGTSITLLLLNKGQRLEVKGPGSIGVDASGLRLQGCTSRLLDSNQQKLSLTGENHRTIGGMVLRNVRVIEASTSPVDKIEVLGGTRPAILLSRRAGEGPPPDLQFVFAPNYRAPKPISQGRAEVYRSEPETRIQSGLVKGEVVAGRWKWQLPYPDSDLKTLTLTLTEHDHNDVVWLYTRVYLTSPDEEKELSKVARNVQQWSAREPQSIQPRVLYASLLGERGRLEESLQQVDKALSLAKDDAGLREMKYQILLDLGRYSQAAELNKSTR